MFATVSRRLTFWYVTAAVALVTVVMLAAAVVVLVFYGRVLQENIEANVREAQAFSARAMERHQPFGSAALEFERRVARTGIHIFASELPRAPGERPIGARRGARLYFTLPYNTPRALGSSPAPSVRRFEVLGGGRSDGDDRPLERTAGGPPDAPNDRPPFPGGSFDPNNQTVYLDGRTVHGSPLILRAQGSRFGFVALALTNTPVGRTPFMTGQLIITPDPDYFQRVALALLGIVGLAALFTGILAWTVGRFITAQALQPLIDVTGRLQRFATRDFTPEPIDVAGKSEFAVLAHAYNAAAAQVADAFDERAAAETHMRQFVADAGHELRTPLTIVLGYLDVLKRRSVNEKDRRIFDTMTIEGQRMRTLIDNLILLARLDSDQVRPIEPFELSELLRKDIVEPRRVIAPAVTFTLEIGVEATVIGDRTEIYEAIANVVDNALKYAPGSPITVRVRPAGGMVEIDVEDKGPGIAEGDRASIFERFYRGAGRGEIDGSGLGLAIAKRAIERAGGTLVLAQSSPAGSTFRFRLRADRTRRVVAQAQPLPV
jgi:signal transduction histidine kinase